MKRHNKIVWIIIFACLFVSCLVLVSCQHKHNLESKWYGDDTYHWKQCLGCDEKVNKNTHTVPQDGWTVVTEPTESVPGLRRGTCSVCNLVVNEDIPRVVHTHSFTGDYLFDDYGHWQNCACGEKGNVFEHVVSSWTIDEDATEETAGLKHGVCDVCRKTVSETIPPLEHRHSYSDQLTYNDDWHYYECSCGNKINVAPHQYSSDWESDGECHWKTCACGKEDYLQAHVTEWIIDKPATTDSTGSKHEACVVCGKVLRTETIDKLTSSTRSVDFYAINDFHGSVDLISSVGGYLKERKNSNANTVLINSGDMFQGSMESNSNYGKLLTDCMDVIGFDSFTFGNHEFDWGLDKLQTLAQNSNVPFLGANIYHWNASDKTWGTFASELAQKYVVKQMDNGLKVGIIGVIGENQITSISSNLVQTIGFKEPLPIIKELATELRSEQGCDVVVVSAHVGPRGLVGESENYNDPEYPSGAHGLDNYVDAVFCAHTHRDQNFVVDGIPFIQGASYGSKVSHVSLSVTPDGKVSCTEHENVSYSNSWSKVSAVDELINNSNAQIADERKQVVARFDSYLNKNPQVPRLVCHAIADYALSQGYEITLAMTNTARNSLSGGATTYSELYEAIPFDNVVYIAKVKGEDILKEAEYMSNGVYSNAIWRVDGAAVTSDGYYYIAVIDYLLFHQNAQRDYNYFPSAFMNDFEPVPLTNDSYEVYNYRFITRDFLLGQSDTVSTSLYRYDNDNNDNGLIRSQVNIGSSDPSPAPDSPKHDGTLYDPYDIADALLLGKANTSHQESSPIYVKCVVCDVSNIKQSELSGDLGNFYVTDESGKTVLVYYVSKSSLQSANWSTVDELNVGDELVMYIRSYVYNGTPQLGVGECITINGEPTY